MNAYDILWLAYKGLISRKIIAALAIIAIMIGVASVTMLVAFTQGVSQTVLSAISSLGPNTIIVSSNGGYKLTQSTVATIESLPGVRAVYPVITGFGFINIEGRSLGVSIIGIDNLSVLLGQVILTSGTVYPPKTTPEAVVGSEIANPFPGVHLTPGSTITVQIGIGNVLGVGGIGNVLGGSRSVSLEVVGILSPSDTSFFLPSQNVIFVPLGEAMAILNTTTYSKLIVKTISTKDVNIVSKLIQGIYGNEVQIESVQQILNAFSVASFGFSFLLIAIASISLFVGAIGIMGIMLSRVYQRIREIGIMKTLGLTTRDVLLVFLAESGIIGLIGGAIGAALGIGGSFIVFDVLNLVFPSRTASSPTSGFKGAGNGIPLPPFKPIVSLEIIAVAIGVAIIVSLIAGIYPALKAAKLTVIDAIRRD